jgi:hypothetical protein
MIECLTAFASFHISFRIVANARDLLMELALAGVAQPAPLRAALRVSPATFARLVADAGEEVYRFGKTRSLRYARTRSIESVGRHVPAFRVSETGAPTPAGTLHLLWGSRVAWEDPRGAVRVYEGLPPALVDMAPQGYLGRGFPQRFPEMRLPQRINDWTDDHRVIALARRGEDCVGNLVIGSESLERFLRRTQVEVDQGQYPAMARASAGELVGSSAGGERPKFGAFRGGRHVLVKFQPLDGDGAARRWRDLLWCEWKALETVASAGRPAARASLLEVDGWSFLEVERFDRVGQRGRRAVLSLAALNNEYLGGPSTWTDAAPGLRQPPLQLPREDADCLRWLDVFGQLIGNSDRHFGNVGFFELDDGTIRLAPAYDMLPMNLAPSGEVVSPRVPDPDPANAGTLDVWPDAARWAVRYWGEVEKNGELETDVRDYARRSLSAVEQLMKMAAVG